MARSTTRADDHEPIGNPEHVAYGKDYYWTCTCGRRASHFTTEDTAHHEAEEHERYCMDNGTTTVKVSQ